ncbi:TRAPP subunit bet5 [Dinochytrium kinnereticum]|nr:TRAPP subunit bet5 [Dinochytrium kinnereticum]
MTIYGLYIFDRHCCCIYNLTNKALHPKAAASGDLSASREPLQDAVNDSMGGAQTESMEEEAKLVYGVVYSLRNVVNKLLTGKNSNEGFMSFKTNVYKLHYFETASGMKFVMTTDPDSETMREVLRQIFASIYVEFVVKNPLGGKSVPKPEPPKEKKSGKVIPPPSPMINNELFKTNLVKYLKSLPNF